MRKIKLLQINWYKLLTVAFLVSLFVVSPVEAAYTQKENTDTNIVKNTLNTYKEIFSQAQLKSSSLAAVGSSLTSISDSLAEGWISFSKIILNNFIEKANDTKDFASSVFEEVSFIKEKVVDSFSSNSNIVENKVEKKKDIKQDENKVQVSNSSSSNLLSNLQNSITSKTEIVKEVTSVRGEQGPKGDTGAMGPMGPVGPQGPKGERGSSGRDVDTSDFVLNSFFENQIDRLFDSISEDIDSSSDSITEGGTLNDSILNRPVLNNATGTFLGTLTGNADTVTNGLYSTGSYSNPTWLTAIPYSILSGTIPTWNQDTTGNAATVTNGLYSNGSYSDPLWLTISKSKVGLANVDNTSDADKPISTLTQNALNLKSNLSGATFTGPISATNLSGTNTGDQTLSGLGGVPTSRLLTINGSSFDLSGDRSWTISDITGNAGTVTNGLYSTGSYSDPSWLTISKSKVGLANVDNTSDATKSVLYAATSGNSSTVTNGIYTNQSYSNPTWLTAIPYSILSGTVPTWNQDTTGNAATVTNGVYTSRTINGQALSSDITISAGDLGLGNVTNESKATMFTSPTFTGTVGGFTIGGDIIPSLDNTHSLGSSTSVWKDVYVGNGSIYVDGQKVLQTNDDKSVVVSSDVNQNLIMKTSGTGDIEFNPSGTGIIRLKGNLLLSGTKTFETSDNSAVIFADGISSPTITTSVLNGGISITPNGSGNTYITSGYLGIGTTLPRATLDVVGNMVLGNNTLNNSLLSIYSTDDGSYSHGITIVDKEAKYGSWQNPSGLDGITTDDAGTPNGWNTLFLNYYSNKDISFNYGGGNSVFNGNVGVGISSPVNKLEVGGTTRVMGYDGAGTGEGLELFYLGGAGYVSAQNRDVASYVPLYLRGSNIDFKIGSDTKMAIDTSGNVGIGTTSPVSQLHVSGSAGAEAPVIGGGSIYVQDSGSGVSNGGAVLFGAQQGYFAGIKGDLQNGGGNTTGSLHFYTRGGTSDVSLTDRMIIRNDGNVGIGTTNPGFTLDVVGTSASVSRYYDSTSGPYLNLIHYRGAVGSPAAVQTGDEFGKIYFYGYDGTSTIRTGARIDAISDTGTISASSMPGKLQFYTTTNGSINPTIKMVIDNGGNVGIGTTTPTAKLHIADNSNGVKFSITGTESSNMGSADYVMASIDGTNITHWNTDTYGLKILGPNAIINVLGKKGVALYTKAGTSDSPSVPNYGLYAEGNGSYTYAATFMNGNVGIGTTGPSQKLEVAGDALFSGASRTVSLGQAGQAWSKLQFLSNGGVISGGSTALYFSNNTGTVNNVTILNNGNVGIGTDSPSEKLHVAGNILSTNLAGTGNRCVYVTGAGILSAKAEDCGSASGADNMGNHTATQNIQLGNYWLSGDGGSEGVFVGSTGNVGIGKTNPSYPLDISSTTIRALNISGAGTEAQYMRISNTGGDSIFGTDRSTGGAIATGALAYSTSLGTVGATALHLLTDDAVRMTVLPTSGNVGIGTTTPVSKLDVNGAINIADGNNLTWGGAYAANIPTIWGLSGASGYLNFAPSGSTNGVAMTMLNNGNVGIGTTAPGAALSIVGSNGGGQLTLKSPATAYLAGFGMENSAGQIITGSAQGDFSIWTSTPGKMNFSANGGSSAQMVLTNTGNVGIGVTAPATPLEIKTASNPPANSGTTTNAGLRMHNTNNGVLDIGVMSGGIAYLQPTNATDLSLSYNLLLSPNGGNVGIGTTSPLQKLDVNGSINMAQGNWLYINNANVFGADASNTYIQPESSSAGFQIRSSAGSPWFTTSTTGNVGIGTTTPGAKLTIYDSTVTSGEHLLTMFNGPLGGVAENNIFKMGFDADGSVITGAFMRAANNIPFQIKNSGGGTGITLLSSGNVGIGTIAPLAKLVVATASNVNLEIRNGADYGLTGVGIDSRDDSRSTRNALFLYGNPVVMGDGNVGIGTTTPTAKFDINDVNVPLNSNGNLYIRTSDSAAIDKGGQISLGGSYNSTLQTSFAGIAGRKENSTNANAAGYLQFLTTTESSGNMTEKMRISNSGNVGIGATNPSSKLHIYQTGALLRQTLQVGDNNEVNFSIQRSGATSPSLWEFYIPVSSTDLRLYNAGDKITVQQGGNVGIGTTNPGTYKLNVNGDVKFGTNVVVGGATMLTEDGSGVLKFGLSGGAQTAIYSASAEAVRISTEGNVGIGTTSPKSRLSFPSASHIGVATSDSEDNGYLTIGGGGAYDITRGGNIVLYGNEYGTDVSKGAVRVVLGDGNSGAYKGRFAVESSSSGEIFTTLNNGNVGIGTANPGSKFDVNGISTFRQVVNLYSVQSGQTDRRLTFNTNSADLTTIYNYDEGESAMYPILIGSNSPANGLTVLGTGGVGIGTATPGKTLDVVGTFGVSGLITAATGIQVTGGSSGQGILNKSSATGLQIRGIAGSTNDYELMNSSGNTVMTVKNGGSYDATLWGNVGFGGNASPSVAVDVTGDIEYTGTLTDVSDERLKDQITTITGDQALSIITSMQAKSFIMRDSGKKEYGYIAQEILSIFPDAVSIIDPETGYLGLNYISFIPLATESIKQLNLKVEVLDSDINGVTLKEMLSDFFGSVVVNVTDGVASIKGLVVETLKVGSPAKRTGITLYDEETGEPYCISVAGGQAKTVSGECGVIDIEKIAEEKAAREAAEQAEIDAAAAAAAEAQEALRQQELLNATGGQQQAPAPDEPTPEELAAQEAARLAEIAETERLAAEQAAAAEAERLAAEQAAQQSAEQQTPPAEESTTPASDSTTPPTPPAGE